MHLSDGVLSTTMIAITSVAGVGTAAFALRGIKTEEISKIALMTAVLLVGGTIHVPVGPTSVHLLLTGFIGLVVGRRTPIVVLVALLLQLFLLHLGGLTTLGANVVIESLPAMLIGMLVRPSLAKAKGNTAFFYGCAAGIVSVAGSALMLALLLIQSNRRYGMGPFSTVSAVLAGYCVLMFVEGLCTGFAVRFLAGVRPDFFAPQKEYHDSTILHSDDRPDVAARGDDD